MSRAPFLSVFASQAAVTRRCQRGVHVLSSALASSGRLRRVSKAELFQLILPDPARLGEISERAHQATGLRCRFHNIDCRDILNHHHIAVAAPMYALG